MMIKFVGFARRRLRLHKGRKPHGVRINEIYIRHGTHNGMQVCMFTYTTADRSVYLPFGFVWPLVTNQPNVADFSYACLDKKLVDFFLLGSQMYTCHKHGAIVALGFFGLALGLLQAALKGLLPLALSLGLTLLAIGPTTPPVALTAPPSSIITVTVLRSTPWASSWTFLAFSLTTTSFLLRCCHLVFIAIFQRLSFIFFVSWVGGSGASRIVAIVFAASMVVWMFRLAFHQENFRGCWVASVLLSWWAFLLLLLLLLH